MLDYCSSSGGVMSDKSPEPTAFGAFARNFLARSLFDVTECFAGASSLRDSIS